MSDDKPFKLRPYQAVILTTNSELGRRSQMIVDAMERAKISFTLVNIDNLPTRGLAIDTVWMDDQTPTMVAQPECHDITRNSFTIHWPVVISPKRRALMAQLERAKVRRDKNSVRDLTRQLENLRD